MYWGDMAGGAATGAGTGAMVGSVVPGVGTGIGAIVGGVAGLGMGYMAGKEKEKAFRRANELAARTQELSPWTGLRAKAPVRALQAPSVIKGVATGASMYGAGKKYQQQEKMANVMSRRYNEDAIGQGRY